MSDIFIETNYYKKKNYYYTQFVIYGRPDPNGYTYELVSEINQELPVPPVKYVQDKEQKYVVYNDEEYVANKGDEGYIVDIYRVTKDGYDMVGDGQTDIERGIRREQIFARVIRVKRKGKEMTERDFWWRFFASAWLILLPLRPLLVHLWGFGKKK
jgi:hypothetical protein